MRLATGVWKAWRDGVRKGGREVLQTLAGVTCREGPSQQAPSTAGMQRMGGHRVSWLKRVGLYIVRMVRAYSFPGAHAGTCKTLVSSGVVSCHPCDSRFSASTDWFIDQRPTTWFRQGLRPRRHGDKLKRSFTAQVEKPPIDTTPTRHFPRAADRRETKKSARRTNQHRRTTRAQNEKMIALDGSSTCESWHRLPETSIETYIQVCFFSFPLMSTSRPMH